tara:strand:+ start:4134 stop:4571 length:438 start_codon:yes stop_codon:yes gene_type:complete
MTKENLTLWNAVCKTDQAYMSKVSFGARSFNAIDPMYQIMKVTKQFGPVGGKWSYHVDYDYPVIGNIMMVVAKVSFSTPNGTFGPVAGSRTFVNLDSKKKANDDAPKMALTDALTKAISHLGFDADVFLGKYDDNKYVKGNNDEF